MEESQAVNLFIAALITFISIYLTYLTAGKLSPRRRSREKEEIYACGEKASPLTRPLSLTDIKYLLLFACLESVPIMLLLVVSGAPPLVPLAVYMLAVYVSISLLLRR